KAAHILLASALAGAALGLGITWADFGHDPPRYFPEPLRALDPSQRGTPRVAVDQKVFDFGYVERDNKVRHVFRITNVGDGELALKPGTTTCTACTIAELAKTKVPPGETSDVIVEYTPSVSKPRFTQIATILTNDPREQRVELEIRGTVTSKYRVMPSSIVF